MACVAIKPEELKDFRIMQLSLTQDQMADRLGIKRNTYKHYEYTNVPRKVERVVRERLGYGASGKLKYKSLAGIPLESLQLTDKPEGEYPNVDKQTGNIHVPANLAAIATMGRVEEDQDNLPKIKPGDTVVFKPVKAARPEGCAYHIELPGGKKITRILRYESGQWIMETLNPSFADPQPLHNDAKVKGMLVGLYRFHGSYEATESDPNGLRLTA